MNFKEKQFEDDIESYMLKYGGYTKGNSNTYDRKKAIDMSKLIQYIEATQPKQWKRYNMIYGADVENKLYKRINESIEMHGFLYVLRHGIEDRGVKLKLASFKPQTGLNQKIINDYNSNILECIRQFKYSPNNENSIDIVLMLNGFPIVALELKNQFTNQSVDNAIKQYKNDRDPRELCFQFNHRFLVYFAVDLYNIEMTTELKGSDTHFLPFNQGSNGAGNVGGAGNPINNDGYSTSYLWEYVLKKDMLMDILQRYMHLSEETKKDRTTGKSITTRKLIFPRYHQLDAVTKLLDDVKQNGSGKNYLIQHSAGSGKSNSIAWLAYGLSNLHDNDDNKIFKSIIVVTDRTVLDDQLQKTIYSFDHTAGVVEKIDEKKNSKDLRDAINDGKKIIITTLQKFPYIYKEIDDTRNKNFAIIVDEAHSSQTGKSAMKLKSALADTEESLKEYAEFAEIEESKIRDNEDKLIDLILAHGRHKNLSFFAFTATPKRRTLEMFGEKQSDGTFKAFHVYSMKQAIQEGFILDVLQNYTTYKNCYKIVKSTSDNPNVPKTKATKAILRYESLHPHNLSQKTAIIVETYRDVTKHKINGKGKAMVVTASRLHALRYYHEFKRYIERKHYDDLDVLIAFSGKLTDIDETGETITYTEESINKRKDGTTIKESQLPEEFSNDNYSMLIVAEKYQTGFDEPLLHTMFVDKKLRDVKAVQTLSRLNRTCEGKEDTFVLDFVNTAKDIENAFKPYYEATILDEEINVNLIYDTRIKLNEYGLYDLNDINNFYDFYKKESKNQSHVDMGKASGIFQKTIKKYETLDEDKQYEYKRTINNFVKWYSYITQITRLFDIDLHKEAFYCQTLATKLPKSGNDKDVFIDDKVQLEFYNLKKTSEGKISIDPSTDDQTLINPKALKTNGVTPEGDDLLENIILKINDKFQGKFTEADKVIVEDLYNRCVKDNDKLKTLAKNNDEEVYIQSIFPDLFSKVAQECYIEHIESFSKLFEDKNFYDLVMRELAAATYKNLHTVNSNR